jgi:hypothetical protein
MTLKSCARLRGERPLNNERPLNQVKRLLWQPKQALMPLQSVCHHITMTCFMYFRSTNNATSSQGARSHTGPSICPCCISARWGVFFLVGELGFREAENWLGPFAQWISTRVANG